ncbi:Sec-independent protein translocase subunit TatA/TatB [Mucilaginibacter pedocola]|uniref:Sec-independent protein translocase subunit TatA/TatB n=1 Tax=Mucilaginibacter pedocola TaxID=1792845 RepID=UPI000992157C|nr:twin-arginine translocase TatA/TatE family subunit [Mucilaginibacter pedocola]
MVFAFLNIGTGEMILIIFAALMLFGGEKLPEIARGLGKGIRDFKDASDDVKREINNQINNYEDKKSELKKSLEDKPKEELPEATTPAYTPIEGTMPAYESHYSATDAIEEETTYTELGNPEAPETYEEVPEIKHPVTGSANTASSINLSKEGEAETKTTIDEEYK